MTQLVFRGHNPGKCQSKSQISSTKLQINLKFQYPMTKTFHAVVPYRGISLCPLVIMPFGTNAGESCVWNFEFGSLEFV
jgi:hypothetical protein